jgi:two-component system nitrate/nitrite response regulator NarL
MVVTDDSPGRAPAVIRVVAADAQPLFGDALCRAIRQRARFQLVGEAVNGRDALRLMRELVPDVAVVGTLLPLFDGQRLLSLAREEQLPTRVILVGGGAGPAAAYELIEQGAAACLTRWADADEVCEAIATVGAGGVYFAREVQHSVAREIRWRAGGRGPVLTRREREILQRIAAGESGPAIAKAMHVSLGTVKTHLAHLYEKLGVAERAAAVAVAMRRGLLD